jgi:hypothetical protein
MKLRDLRKGATGNQIPSMLCNGIYVLPTYKKLICVLRASPTEYLNRLSYIWVVEFKNCAPTGHLSGYLNLLAQQISPPTT